MELTVVEERFQAFMESLQSDAAESGLEQIAKNLDAIAKLLLRAKDQLGMGDVQADPKSLKHQSGFVGDIVIGELDSLDIRQIVSNLDRHDRLGSHDEYAIAAVRESVLSSLEFASNQVCANA